MDVFHITTQHKGQHPVLKNEAFVGVLKDAVFQVFT